ncbi:MAG: glycosyltransferase [Chloroflexi bacterium]|nr:glycosyltransferase [Chloroflexota bacterium]
MYHKATQPIFFDPQNRRWRRFKLIAQLVGLLLTLVFCGLIVSVMLTPSLPKLALAPVSRLIQQSHASPTTPTPIVTKQDELSSQKTRTQTLRAYTDVLADKRLKSSSTKKNVKATKPFHSGKANGVTLVKTDADTANPTTTVPPAPQPVFQSVNPVASSNTQVIGFFVNWDDNSLASLKQNATHLDKLIPEWLHLTDANGAIAPDDPARQQQVIALIQQLHPGLPIVPLINNYDNNAQNWSGGMLGQMLSNPAARAQNIQALLDYVQSNHFAGVSIDYENVPTANQADLTTYMSELYAKFHPLGLEVSQSVPADDNSYDYRALAKYNDYMILMTYDEHWDGSNPGAVASQNWFATILQTRFSEVDPSKFVVGIGNYGYDWIVGTTQSTEVTFQQAIQTAQDSGATIRLDPVTLNSTYDYTDSNGASHQVWLLDALSAFNQIAATHQYPVRGVALWRMGSEDPAIWNVLDNRANLNNNAVNGIEDLKYGYDVLYQGTGEILKITSVPSDGQRAATYDSKLGLVTSEQYLSFPSPYVVTRWGGNDKTKIAITFDDGPDPNWTPQILNILKQYNVPATFFVIGSSATQNPGLLQQIVNQGNEVGNHTYTHPDLSAVPQEQEIIELNATQRLFESVLGRRSVLFRPPYSEDVEPDTPDQVKPLVMSGQLGYYTIGMQIDPQDYLQPGVDTIVQRVMDQVASSNGNVILLHDGGGDRSQTIAALPLIIQGLQARGYRLVTVSDLMGVSRDQVMPLVSPGERIITMVSGIGFQTTNGINQFLSTFFLLGIALGLVRFVSIIALAIAEKRLRAKEKYKPDYQPKLSIIVPAYNEVKVIERTIHALLKTTYPVSEIIVVDDGSTDNTFERVNKLFGHNPKVIVYRKQNAGKAEALNFGIERAQSEIVMAMDADTIIHPQAAGKLIRHFADSRVGAVAGNAKVGNRINLLTNWQALEYITSQNLDRRAFALLNSITVVPGAIGMWRRDLVLKLGDFNNDTLAEDADMTLRILRRGYKVEYDEKAFGYTEAPDTVRGFLKQRFRWTFGTLQAAWKHRDTLLRPKYGALGMLALPNIFIFQVLFPFISPLMDLTAILSIAEIFWRISQHPIDPSPTGLVTLIFFYALFLALDFFTAMIAILLEKKEDWNLIIWLFPQRFFYRQLMYYIVIKSVTTAIQGRRVGWGKLERKATIQAELGHD